MTLIRKKQGRRNIKAFFSLSLLAETVFTMDINAYINQLLDNLEPITLEQMSNIRLMNRTDTKFVTDKEHLVKLLEMAQGKYYVQFNDGSRVANYMTTYWDTDAHTFYLEHHNGRAPRQKVRVRTYLDSNISFLEVKTKNNHGRTRKKRMRVPGQEINEGEGRNEFLKELVHMGMDEIHPTVRNRFKRITLVNKGKTERLTIDFDVQFHNMETGGESGTGQLVIIELKRDGNVFSPVLDILRSLRIRPSGFSKYCIGSVLTNRSLKYNMFKPKLVRLSKLTKEKLFLGAG